MADISLIRDGMDVIASDGEHVGRCAGVEREVLAVTPPGGGAAGRIPLDWVSRVDEHVHLGHGAPTVRGRMSGIAEPMPHRTEGRLKGPWVIGGIFLLIALVLLILGLFYQVRI